MVAFYREGKPVVDKLKTIHFTKSRQKYEAEHDRTLHFYHLAERKLKGKAVNGKFPVSAWQEEKKKLETECEEMQTKLAPLYADTKKLWAIHYNIHEVQHEQERQQKKTRNHEIDR